MKKIFHVAVVLVALLSFFTVSASAEFGSADSANLTEIKKQVQAIRDQLGYPPGGFSSLRDAVNHIANNLPTSPNDYSTVLSNIYSNISSLASTVVAIKGDTNNISHRSTDILNKLADINTNIGVAQIAITNHVDSASALNHSDFTNLLQIFATSGVSSASQSGDSRYRLYTSDGSKWFYSWDVVITHLMLALTNDQISVLGDRSLYGRIKQLQEVLASDDDLQLKQDNKANEDAATDAFVNGSSSKTSLGAGDIGNLKDVGGSFNDLTSLNGQSSVTSFLNGLTSADGTGQGWFSEATRASLDAVSTPVTTTNLVRKTWRGEKSLIYSISADTSVNVVASPAPARAPVADPDPYNMSGFEDNYNWLWGDAS